MKTGTIKMVMIWLLVAFVVVNIWKDPQGSADYAGEFLGSIGSFVSTLIEKTAKFLTNLGGSRPKPSGR